MARMKECPWCKGLHRKKSAYLRCKRLHHKEKWPK